MILSVYKNSYAERYAIKNGFKFDYYQERTRVPNNFDLYVIVHEYTPVENTEERYKEICKGYFPYPRVFPYKDAHMFGKFMLDCAGKVKDEDGTICFNPEKGKWYTFVIIYRYYRSKKKVKTRYKRVDVFYK